MGRVVLVTGISRDIGRRFARAAAGDPSIDRVIGVDVVPPHGDIGGVSFVRADIRSPVIAKVLAKEDVDTVVHMSVIATPGSTVPSSAVRVKSPSHARRVFNTSAAGPVAPAAGGGGPGRRGGGHAPAPGVGGVHPAGGGPGGAAGGAA